MLYETLSQPKICLIIIIFGFCLGAIFDIEKFFVFSSGNNKIIQFFSDVFSLILYFVLFYIIICRINYGEIRLYQLLIFILSSIGEHFSLGKGIAILLKIVYNKIEKLKKKGD